MKPSTRKNFIFTVAIVALAGALLFFRRRAAAQAAAPWALLQYGQPMQMQCIELTTDASYDIDTGFYTIHLRVEDGAIAFVDSPCPDHLCEGFGWLREPGDWAACLPALASLSIEEGETP